MYLIIRADRNAEDLHLNGTCTETSRFKQLVPFAIAERFIIAKPVGPDYLIGVKNQLLFRTQLRQFNGGRDATSR